MTTVIVTGKAGANGNFGTANGGNGRAADALSIIASGPDNTAIATGGSGGFGGEKGGSGGTGGDADAKAITTLPTTQVVSATATARAGDGGAGLGGGAAGDGADADATADATNTVGDASASAASIGGLAGSAARVNVAGYQVTGAPGVAGQVSATATALAAGQASASVVVTGGANGPLQGNGTTCGDGGGIGTVRARAVGGTGAIASVRANGGNGGFGYFIAGSKTLGANGGNGASVALINRVSGSTKLGQLTLQQVAAGGSGGGATGATAGNGGDADSKLTVVDTTGAAVVLVASAIGGNGGSGGTGFDGLHGKDGDGGSATAVANLKATGSAQAAATANGGSPGGDTGLGGKTASADSTASSTGGAATASATSSGLDVANAQATAVAAGHGNATAQFSVAGASGRGTATAVNTGNGVTVTTTTTQTERVASPFSSLGGISAAITTTPSRVAFGTPDVTATGGAGVAFHQLPADFKTLAVTNALGSAAMGAILPAGSAPQSYGASVDWQAATAGLAPGSVLEFGLVDAPELGAGLAKLAFTLTENGTVVTHFTTTSTNAAEAFFADHLIGLGPWQSHGSTTLDVKASLSVTLAGAGSAFGVDLLAALVKPPPQFIQTTAATTDVLAGTAATGELYVGAAADLQGASLAHLLAGDGLDLTDIAAGAAHVAYSAATGLIQVRDAVDAVTFHVDTGLAGAFHVRDDGSGGTLVYYGHV